MAYLVTGAMGCLGAWVLKHLVDRGERTVSFDLNPNRNRLDLLMAPEEQDEITFVNGDLTDYLQVERILGEYEVTHIIHLAALQIPFCRADPVAGASVNVVGTTNIFQAALQTGIRHLTYASSVAVYGPPESYPDRVVPADAPFEPQTLYGVFKQANEGTAKVYWQDHGLSSVALRPYTVYGVGRDQGLTSEPTKAMLAAALGTSYHVPFGGKMQFHLASDVAQQFIRAADKLLGGAYGFNLGGAPVAVEDVAKIIEKAKPEVSISCADVTLPFPDGLGSGSFDQYFPDTAVTTLEKGVSETIAHFERCLLDGRLGGSAQRSS